MAFSEKLNFKCQIDGENWEKNCGNYKFRLEFLHLLAGIQQLDLNLEKISSVYIFATNFLSSLCLTKGQRFSEKDWYYLQAQTDMPFHYLKLVVWIFPLFLLLMSVGLAWKSAAKQKQTKCNFKNSSLR